MTLIFRIRSLARRVALLLALLIAFAPSWVMAQPAPPAGGDRFAPGGTLRAFASEDELRAWFEPFTIEKRRVEEERRRMEEERRAREAQERQQWEAAHPGQSWEQYREARERSRALKAPMATMAAPAAPAPAAPAAAGASESITNNQVAGVDEGGIVKVHGRHLVVLRRGRLFTINVDQHEMYPVSSINAYGPDVSPRGAWYDEMLIAGDTVVVIGYSYQRGGTELGLFHIDGDGRLSYRGTWHLRSSDYYSSRNYASRLVGQQLVIYAPVPLGWQSDPFDRLPGVRPWREGAERQPFERIAPATRIYRTDEPLDARAGITLHTVVRCDLSRPGLSCTSAGVLGPPGRVFHVSGRAVYVWTAGRSVEGGAARAAVFRLPLDGGAPSALKTRGAPVDQFSFLEDDSGHLNVLLRAAGGGEGMWRAEQPASELALLRVPLAEFGDGQSSAAPERYRPLPPALAARHCSLQNRFIGAQLLYGAGCAWGRPGEGNVSALRVLRVDRVEPVATIALEHAVDRIDTLGGDAVVIGGAGRDLAFSAVSLRSPVRRVSMFTLPEASQGETRSHGFFYRPDEADSGLLGLPVRGASQPGWRQLSEPSSGLMLLRNRRLELKPVGRIDAQPGVGRQDGCQASCTDWYGNARPIFLRNRLFALLGYELVEGRVLREADGGERVVETRRVAFHPDSPDYRR